MGFNLEKIEPSKKNEKSFDLDALLKKEISLGKPSFSGKHKASFYGELAVLLKAGITLKESLQLIAQEQTKKKHNELVLTLVEELIQGKSLSECLKSHKAFTDYEYFSVKIGEETGNLFKVAEELGLFYERKTEQRRTIMNALSYPIIVSITAFLAVVFMLQFVVPMFVDIFKQNRVELPALTRAIIRLSNGFQEHILTFFIVIGILILFKRILKNKAFVQRYSAIITLKIPYFGELMRKIYLAQFTQAISLLISAKIPLLNCIQLTSKMIRFYPLQAALKKVEKEIIQGKLLSESLSNFSIFDRKMISLLKVAEQSNQNAFIFEQLSDQYNKDIQYKSKLLSTVLEPFIIIFLGALVAVILVAMYLPMFKLSTVIG